MAEAQRMADDYFWVEKANQKEEAARQERQKAAKGPLQGQTENGGVSD